MQEPRVVCPYTQNYMVPKQNRPWLQGGRKGGIYDPPLLPPASIPAREPTHGGLQEQGDRLLYCGHSCVLPPAKGL